VCLPAFLGLLTLTPLPDCVQDHRRGVVIVRHLALSSLPDQLFPGRLDRFCLSLTISHCVEADIGIPRLFCGCWSRWKGIPLQYFSNPTMLAHGFSSLPLPFLFGACYSMYKQNSGNRIPRILES